MKFQWRLSLSVIFFALVVGGCAPTTNLQQPAMSDTQKLEAKISTLLEKASKHQEPKASLLRAEAAQNLITLSRYEEAYLLTGQINLNSLPLNTRVELGSFQASEALKRKLPETTLRISEPLLADGIELSKEQTLELLQLQQNAYNALGQPFNSLNVLINIAQLQDSSEAIQSTHNAIWNTLTSLDTNILNQKLRDGSNTYTLQGWLELYSELKNNKQIDTQHQALNRWRSIWEQHPANQAPPSLLARLATPTQEINRIAVLLPFEGKYAQVANAIKEGLLIAHYRQQNSGSSGPELLFLDSTQINSAFQLAAISEEKQIDLIIGPLDKDFVNELANDPQITTPILALNYTDEVFREGLYQFGLSAEDEAKQLAQKAWKDGIRSVALLTPDTSWGERINTSFIEAFAALGGQVASNQTFADTEGFSANVARLLNTDTSTQRYSQIRQTVYSRKIEFEEHRRTDIDAIILTALPNDARQLSPILAFNFAGNLPIYATSHIYTGTPDPIQDQDLNNIMFLGTPWSLQPPSQNKVLLAQERADTSSRLGRFYALGVDAYRIYPYLKQLIALPGTEIYGETGILSLNQKGQVERTLLWAKYKDGTPLLTE